MTDRIAEQGAVQYAQSNPSAPASRLGAAGWIQGAIADAVANGSANLTASRLGGRGRIHALAASAGPGFLFGNGEQGVWLDFFDTSTTFQSSDGTTPATSATDPIGYVGDKSGNGNHATQTVSGARMLMALNAHGKIVAQADGTDDFFVTPAIDFSATDEVTIFIGVYSPTNAGQTLVELSAVAGSSNGAWYARVGDSLANPANTYIFASRGTALANSTVAATFPDYAVLSHEGKISTDTALARRNGVDGTPSITDQGAGNYGAAYPIYIGMRAGTSIPAGVQFSSIIVVNRLCTVDEHALVNAYIASNMGITL